MDFYEFNITIFGKGEDPDEAFEDALTFKNISAIVVPIVTSTKSKNIKYESD